MTDANTAALYDHLYREDRAAERVSEARARVAARFWNDPEYFREQMLEYGPDELIEMIGRSPTDFWLGRTDAIVAQSLICSLTNAVYAAHEELAVDQESQRIE